MKPFADTNWLANIFFKGRNTEATLRWTAKHDYRLTISRPVLFEASVIFRREAESSNPRELSILRDKLQNRVIAMSTAPWEDIERKADTLVSKYAPKLSIGSLDTLIVASALLEECDWFLSYDTNSHCRSLAALCKLKVFPELTAADKAVMARAS